MVGQPLPECVAPVAAPVPASTDLAATFIITSGSVFLILLFIASLWFLLRPRFEEKTPVASVELPPGQRSTDGSAPRVDQTARPTGADPTGAPPSCKSEETGSADSPTAECVTSALALTQRVRDLGLHLGDIVVTGLSIGLPNALTGRPVFDEANLSLLMRGDNLIGPLPEDMLQAQLDRNVVQVHKAADGTRVRKPLNMVEDVIKLASRIGQFDLVSEYGLSPAIVETLDTTYALAVAAGLEVRKLNRLRAMLRGCCLRHRCPHILTEICLRIVASAQALRNAGLIDAPPKKERSDFTSAESTTDSDWRLSREHRDETGVVFASSFPALDSLIEELSRAMANAVDRTRAQTRKQARDEWLRGLREMATRRAQEEQAADAAPSEKAVRMAALAELNKWLAEEEASSADGGEDVGHHELNRKLLFKLLVMANAQLAEIVQVRRAFSQTAHALPRFCRLMSSSDSFFCRREAPTSKSMLHARAQPRPSRWPWTGCGRGAAGAWSSFPPTTQVPTTCCHGWASASSPSARRALSRRLQRQRYRSTNGAAECCSVQEPLGSSSRPMLLLLLPVLADRRLRRCGPSPRAPSCLREPHAHSYLTRTGTDESSELHPTLCLCLPAGVGGAPGKLGVPCVGHLRQACDGTTRAATP